MNTPQTKLILLMLAVVLTCTIGAAQGIKAKRVAVVLYGAVSNCTQPAVVDFKAARKATPEWREIRAEGVRKGCGRYDLLVAAMSKRIQIAVAEVAEREVRDCVVSKGGIQSANGLQVKDLTAAVLAELRG